ncbi:aldo/keto reductase [Agromyces seonyuensis]|uniref:Aldo/keto reductase n=1 Tax=Agromyces seonyuensis TaxID=2662446 RepID=A0A6I4NV46_9MICO|nr:aldo/keto reductase [Agromyces seonyuensis]MWB97971.1 aldo/keto reductase [Agromyces seonyuensis]
MTDLAASTDRVRFGASALEIAPLALGGNVFGWTADRDASFAVLDAFTAGGGNFIDTADGYSHWVPGHTGGESEAIIGEWIAARGNREDVVVATKVSTKPDRAGLSPENIRAAVDESLARLGVERIDLYYAHFDDESVPLADTAGAFSELVDAGKIAEIGISNYSPERIDDWFSVVDALGLHRPVALQPHYNLLERGFEGPLRERAERHGLAVFPYFGLAKGFLAGKYRSAEDAAVEGASPRAAAAVGYLERGGDRVLAALDEIAAAQRVPVAAVSLAWLRRQPTIAAPIASARTIEQLPALLASLRVDLTAGELAALDAASRTA